MGEKIRKSFTDLRQAQIDLIDNALEEENLSKPMKGKSQEPQNVINIATNINPKGAQGYKQPA